MGLERAFFPAIYIIKIAHSRMFRLSAEVFDAIRH